MKLVIVMLLLALTSFAQKDSLIALTNTTAYDSIDVVTNVTMLNIDANAKSTQSNGYNTIKYKVSVSQTSFTTKYWITKSLIHIYDRNMFKIGHIDLREDDMYSTTVDIIGNDIPAYIIVESTRMCRKEYPYNDSLKECTTNPTCTDSQYSTTYPSDFGYQWKCNAKIKMDYSSKPLPKTDYIAKTTVYTTTKDIKEEKKDEGGISGTGLLTLIAIPIAIVLLLSAGN